MMRYQPTARPTLHFIGVTTGQSSIMRVFPAWADALGLEGAAMNGIDFPLHAPPDAYREAVAFIKADEHSMGALVTTHKIDLYEACRDLFDEIEPHAALMEETSCLSKRGGRLICHAKDPITSGLALDAILEPGHFSRTGGELFAMGAGGSAIAITWHLMRPERGSDRPSRIIVSDRSADRLDAIRTIHEKIGSGVPTTYRLVAQCEDNDAIVESLRPSSLIINATGLGKDGPGSPLTGAARFPMDGTVWDLNYRGELLFLVQARAQAAERRLRIEDGWVYFLHGWTRVIAEVFDIDIPTSGKRFDALAALAAREGR
jgi:shikimate 5-dehydrogenase